MTVMAPRSTANPAPLRVPGSLRRTSSIDVEWPGDMQEPRLFHGRARDILNPADGGAPRVLEEAAFCATLDFTKLITAIEASPAPEALQSLVGQRGGGHLRMFIREVMPELVAEGAPLYLPLDDLSGVSLIVPWAWGLWHPQRMADLRNAMPQDQLDKYLDRAGICWGLKPGNSGLQDIAAGGNGGTARMEAADGGDLRNPEDPDGWHAFPAIAGISMRRARRIDVMPDRAAGLIRIDSAFQDSAPLPPDWPRRDGAGSPGRAALHEYRLAATVDAASLEILTLEPEPRVLPFPECPGAVANTARLIGARLPDIRDAVLGQLRGPEGCTHLNDALRALADVPALLAKMDAA